MFEESVSLWASIYSWFTPTVLFVVLNLTIATIAITSRFAATAPKSNGQDQTYHNQIQRSPSVLQRLKSINFHPYRSPEPFPASEKSPDFASHLGFQNENQQPASIEQNQPFFSRSPSVLQRITSFNLYNYISQEQTSPFSGDEATAVEKPQPTTETKQITEQTLEKEEEEEEVVVEENSPTMDEVYSKLKGGHVNHVMRTMSDTEPAAGEIPSKLPRKIRKSASTKSPFAHFEEEDIVEARRPATVKEGKAASFAPETEEAADEEVDVKADDFINRFKQQLKLQRVDSILRYKETVERGSRQ